MGNCFSKKAEHHAPTGIVQDAKVSDSSSPSLLSTVTAPYLWGDTYDKENPPSFPVHPGYKEARRIIGPGSLTKLEELTTEALQFITQVFNDVRSPSPVPSQAVYEPRLSPSLRAWRAERHANGFILPSKGHGLGTAPPEILKLMGAKDWPLPLAQNGALWGCGMANMLIGAYDEQTMYSNYCVDLVFYYEHGYHKVFPEFEDLIRAAARDPYAIATPAGIERRTAVAIGMQYIKGKIELETKHKRLLSGKVARMNRRTAQVMFFSESSLMGMSAETIVRGFDAASVMSDMVFSSPGTDVVDVGSDLHNSEVMNAFLNTADISDTGIVTEEALKRVYDAYASSGARMFTERWREPVARMCATLYTWHIQNNRHGFCRRALLGYPIARKSQHEQREADFDEVFDADLRTTGFSRPLQNACNGGDPCNHVERLLSGHESEEMLSVLWKSLVTSPMEYIALGVVSQQNEDSIAENLSMAMAQTYALRLIDDMTWLISHANFHAWQVNHLFEAAMFGSLLDDGGLKGKLDRQDH